MAKSSSNPLRREYARPERRLKCLPAVLFPRSKEGTESGAIRAGVALAEKRRTQTLAALKQVDARHVVGHREVEAWVRDLRAARRSGSGGRRPSYRWPVPLTSPTSGHRRPPLSHSRVPRDATPVCDLVPQERLPHRDRPRSCTACGAVCGFPRSESNRTGTPARILALPPPYPEPPRPCSCVASPVPWPPSC